MRDLSPRQRRAVLALCCYSVVTVSFAVAGPAVLMPAIARDLGLDFTRQGLLFSGPMWAFLLSLLGAAIADRIGCRLPLLAAAAIQAAGWWWFSRAETFGAAFAGALTAGIGTATADPLLTPLVCAAFPDRRTRVSNFLHGFYCVGVVLTTLAVAAALHAGWGWRAVARLLAVASLPYGLAALVVRLPRQLYAGARQQSTAALLREPLLWLLALLMFLAGATELATTDWLPALLQSLPGSHAAVGEVGGAMGLVAFGVLMGTGRFLAVGLERRLGVRRLLTLSAALCVAGLAAAALPLPVLGTAACLSMVGFGVGSLWPSLLAVAGDRFPAGGVLMYSALSVAGGLGCAVAPALVGRVAGACGGLAPAIACLALAPAAILAGVWRGLRPGSPHG